MKYELFFDDPFESKQTPLCIQQKEAIEDLKQAYYLLQTSSASFIIQNRKIKPYIKYIQIKKIITTRSKFEFLLNKSIWKKPLGCIINKMK